MGPKGGCHSPLRSLERHLFLPASSTPLPGTDSHSPAASLFRCTPPSTQLPPLHLQNRCSAWPSASLLIFFTLSRRTPPSRKYLYLPLYLSLEREPQSDPPLLHSSALTGVTVLGVSGGSCWQKRG